MPLPCTSNTKEASYRIKVHKKDNKRKPNRQKRQSGKERVNKEMHIHTWKELILLPLLLSSLMYTVFLLFPLSS
jgi:hypothetical protein